MRRISVTATVADIDAWWDRHGAEAERIVAQGWSTTAALGDRYMRAHAGLEGVDLVPVRAQPNQQEIATSLRVTGPVAFKTNLTVSGSEEIALRTMADRLAGSASRLTLTGQRSTVMNTFARSSRIAGWRRITSGNPCAFCAMLASRGAVYRPGGGVSPSGSGVTFAAHDSCRCTAEPLYREEPEPASVLDLRTQWDEATAGLSGKDALNAFRQARS